MLYCSILLHCIDLTLHFAFMPSMCNIGYYSLVIFLYWHYMFWPNQPSSGVQVFVIKESVVHCNAVLFLVCSCLGLLLVMWVNQLFYLGVLELHVFALWFCWFVGCGCLECSCWGGSLLCDGHKCAKILMPCVYFLNYFL
jgi:hypothetical protein